ncbi:helix-turn-helix domain-containing protein [Nitrosomonas sp. JL21]|uniref:helix-turn-helix domain-containing protein n=1 Tax=Nitrosomonas sp. JL21 TaxID=153949 RepID=UPI0013680D08|nr:helix-turn-helix domain-containing protein [Nitrosomonas sp. JL21]MXS77954.1 helix-turn-helix domain-containing protein [Nitrosomonas sp. JL21]
MYNLILTTNILRILREKKISKAELSERAGVSISFLNDLTHDNANPSLRIIEAIAKALGTPLPLLFDSSDLRIYNKPTTPSTTEEQIRNNPLGIYIQDFSWSKQT